MKGCSSRWTKKTTLRSWGFLPGVEISGGMWSGETKSRNVWKTRIKRFNYEVPSFTEERFRREPMLKDGTTGKFTTVHSYDSQAFGGLNYIEKMCDRMERDALLKLDAREGEPQLYLSYEHGIEKIRAFLEGLGPLNGPS